MANPQPGYIYHRLGPSRVRVDAQRSERLLAAGIARPSLLIASARRFDGGRGGAYHMTLGGEDIVMRVYKRGGLARVFLRDRTFDVLRSFREVDALAAARARGVPVVEPVAAVVTSAGLGLSRHYLFTILEPGASPMLDVLNSQHCGRERKLQIIEAAGAAIRMAFENGIEPADLHPRNILISEAGEISCKLVDLDGAAVTAGPLPPAVRTAVLARFVRYLGRHAADGGRAMSRADVSRLIRNIEMQDWKTAWRAIYARVARAKLWHLVGGAWSPRPSAPPSLFVNNKKIKIGPQAAMAPVVSFVMVVKNPGEARAIAKQIIKTAEDVGVQSYEIVGAARSDRALAELRADSLIIPSLRFLADAFASPGQAWRAGLRAARGARIIGIESGALDPRFLTEALERMQQDTDLVVGVRENASSESLTKRAFQQIIKIYLKLWRRYPARDPHATFAARHDDRFDAALRAVHSEKFPVPDFIIRLCEAGAKVKEVPLSGFPRQHQAPAARER
ncbi:MAG: lipopolysaccharide kinase InaA family protein [Planctomycetota bacterium]